MVQTIILYEFAIQVKLKVGAWGIKKMNKSSGGIEPPSLFGHFTSWNPTKKYSQNLSFASTDHLHNYFMHRLRIFYVYIENNKQW